MALVFFTAVYLSSLSLSSVYPLPGTWAKCLFVSNPDPKRLFVVFPPAADFGEFSSSIAPV